MVINVKVKDKIKEEILSAFKEEELQKESFEYTEFYIKSSVLTIDGKSISIFPQSYGFASTDEITGKVISLEKIRPGYVIRESLKNKVLFVKHLNQYDIPYLVDINPSCVLTTSDIKKPLYIKDFPIFRVSFPFFGNEKIKIKVSIKEEEEVVENTFVDFGLGNYYIFIHFPYDSRFQEEENLEFYGSFLVIKDIIDRIINVGYPKGFKIRILFTENKFSNYIGLQRHLENFDTDNLLSIINIDGCGLGNEKLITISNKKKIIDTFHIAKTVELMKSLGIKIKKERCAEYFDFSFLDVPIVWLFSQPNIHMYELNKGFLDEKIPVEFSSTVFYLLNNLYKDMI